MICSSQVLGRWAEDRACAYLQRQGLRLDTRNYRSSLGEIDLIMWDGRILVFVEVRTRSHQDFGGALESITRSKQLKIIKTALGYLQKKRLFNKIVCRFDVISVSGSKEDVKIQWIKQAFTINDYF